MRIAVVRIVLIALVVTLLGATLDTFEAAQCIPAKLFASAGPQPGLDDVRIEPGTAENAGNEIGRFWQSSNSYLGNNFNGGCPSSNGDMSWWQVNPAGLRRIEGWLSASASDGTICDPVTCPAGSMTLVVEEISADGEDALVIGFRVDETSADARWWDFSRVDPAPSPSRLPLLSFPTPNVVSSSALPNGNIQVDLLIDDVAPNVHAVEGPDDDPLPASSIVSSYDLYTYEGLDIPGRDVADWTLVERVPYEDGPVNASIEVSCEDMYVAIGLSFDGGEGPVVVSSFVGRSLQLECTPNPVHADAGEDRVEECAGPEGTPVTLDGTGTTGANEVQWLADGVEFDNPNSYTPTGLFPMGTTDVSLIAYLLPYLDTDSVQVTILDETEPLLTCGLNVAGWGMGDDGEGFQRFSISLQAEDVCCMETEVSAEIDLGWAQLPVVDGQVIELGCSGSDDEGDDESDDCANVGNCGGLLTVRSADATLLGVATDCNGNTATCELDLCDPPRDGAHDAVESTPGRESGRMKLRSAD